MESLAQKLYVHVHVLGELWSGSFAKDHKRLQNICNWKYTSYNIIMLHHNTRVRHLRYVSITQLIRTQYHLLLTLLCTC